MVEIPSSRAIRRVPAASGRPFVPGPRESAGRGMQAFGQQLQRAGYNLLDLADRQAADTQAKSGYDAALEAERFRRTEEEAFNKALDSAPADGIGFARQFMEGHEQRANDFVQRNFAGLSPSQDARARQGLMGFGNQLYKKADSHENKLKSVYYDDTTNTELGNLRKSIAANSGNYDDLKGMGAAIIDRADMPPAWKADRRRAWDADAAESRWQWEFKQDPRAAVDDLSGGSGMVSKAQLSGTVQERGGYALQRFMDKGYTREQAAGIVGNLIAESGMDPSGAVGDQGTAFGLAQWRKERFDRLKSFANQQGKDWKDFDTQIDFIDYELKNYETSAYQNLQNAQTVDEATAAFIGYERPKGWTANNPRGGHAYKKRLSNAAAFVEGDVSGSWTPSSEYADIPYERQQKLLSYAGREIAGQSKQTRDELGQQIRLDPFSVTVDDIVADNRLETSDQNALIDLLDRQQGEFENENRAADRYRAGEDFNPFVSDDRKDVDRIYSQFTRDEEADGPMMAVAVTERTGIAPRPAMESIQADVRSGDPQKAYDGAALSSALLRTSPVAFEGTGGAQELTSLARNFDRMSNLGYSAEQIGNRLVEMQSPEWAAKSELREKEARKLALDLTESDITGGFIDNLDPLQGDVSSPEIGAIPERAPIVMQDAMELFTQAYVQTGDEALSKKIMQDTMGQAYGVSKVFDRRVYMRFPPEKTYPATSDGSHDYIRSQALSEARDATGEDLADEDIALVALGGDIRTVDDIRLIKAGVQPSPGVQGPRYSLVVKRVDPETEQEFYESLGVFWADYEAGEQAIKEGRQADFREMQEVVDDTKAPQVKEPTDLLERRDQALEQMEEERQEAIDNLGTNDVNDRQSLDLGEDTDPLAGLSGAARRRAMRQLRGRQ